MHPIPDYTRRIAVVTSTAPGARSVDIQRAANELLFKNNLSALSSLEGQRTLYDGMERLGLAVNGADNASSAATAIGDAAAGAADLFGLAVQPQPCARTPSTRRARWCAR